jgi:hypothetical protein
VDLQLAGMIVFGLFGVAFFISVWIWMRRTSRRDEPPER